MSKVTVLFWAALLSSASTIAVADLEFSPFPFKTSPVEGTASGGGLHDVKEGGWESSGSKLDDIQLDDLDDLDFLALPFLHPEQEIGS